MRNLIKYSVQLFSGVLSLALLYSSPVSIVTTWLFIIVFNTILYFSLSKFNKTPSVSVFGILVWLGVFLKAASFCFTGRGLRDPTGVFSGTLAQWNDLFYVSICGGMAFIATFFIVDFFVDDGEMSKGKIYKLDNKIRPPVKSYFYLIFFAALSVVTFANIFYGITISGLASVTHLPMKLNAISGWMIYSGFSLILCVLFYMSLNNKRYFNLCLILVFVEGLFCSVSIISRGLYLFHVVPTVAVLLLNHKVLELNYRKLTLICAVFLLGLFFNVGFVTHIRSYLFNRYAFHAEQYTVPIANVFQTANDAAIVDQTHNNNNAFFSSTIKVISDLAVNRWVGLEGLMSIVSYEKKSTDLLTESLFRVPKIGEQDVFSKISGFSYDTKNYKITFAFIPGPFALFYYSGQLAVVFLGIFALCMFLFLCDQIVWKLLKNPFVSYQMGVYLGVNAAHFGLSPLPIIKALIMTAAGLFCLFVLTRYLEFKVRDKHRSVSIY